MTRAITLPELEEIYSELKRRYAAQGKSTASLLRNGRPVGFNEDLAAAVVLRSQLIQTIATPARTSFSPTNHPPSESGPVGGFRGRSPLMDHVYFDRRFTAIERMLEHIHRDIQEQRVQDLPRNLIPRLRAIRDRLRGFTDDDRKPSQGDC